MVKIDGSAGEGGGQILRTSLALSLITGKPFHIENIRAGRKKPGLLKQHLTCVAAAAEIGQAILNGDQLGSTSLEFFPHGVHPGRYNYQVGTAGSTSLVLQAVLPALLLADAPSEITLEGGTHNPFAPPFPFLQRAFLPLIQQMGPNIEAQLERPGFYPGGGGRVVYRIKPAATLKPLFLRSRGKFIGRLATAIIANLPLHIAQRELQHIRRKLTWDDKWLTTEVFNDRRNPGNIVTIEVASENITEIFTGFGERGRPAEEVAYQAVIQAKHYIASEAVVSEYLADQLLLPFALAGKGAFTTNALSAHTTTNIETIQKFLDVKFVTSEIGKNLWLIEIT